MTIAFKVAPVRRSARAKRGTAGKCGMAGHSTIPMQSVKIGP
jgi:hypothetical protein